MSNFWGRLFHVFSVFFFFFEIATASVLKSCISDSKVKKNKFFLNKILLNKRFQVSQSWHQLTVYENKILVQNCLLIEWTLTYLFFWWFLNLERNFGVRKWSKITALLANLYLVKAREKKSIFCHMYWNLNWLKNWNLNENQNRKLIAKFHMQHLVLTPLYIGWLKVS